MKVVVLLTSLIILYSCNNQGVDTEAEEKKLMELSREWSRIAASGDTAKIFSYWAEDAVMMSPGQPALKGKDAIREMVMGSFKVPGFKISWEPQSVEVSKSGDLAYLIEENQITVNDSLGNPLVTKNKALTVWKKQGGGSWKNVVDMWNANN